MSEASLQESVSLESLVAGVADEFMERQRKGERPRVEEYAARHPEAADLLRKVLTALEVVGLSLPGSASLPEDELAGVLGDFRLLREVGRGGMGVVYEAEQISLRRRVALKVLPFAATMDPRHLQRFHNEARAAACLHHTNIVPVHAVGCERGVHFYAMQFIDGQTLAQRIAELRGEATDAVATAKAPPASGAAVPMGEATEAYTPSPVLPAAETGQDGATATQRPALDGPFFHRVAEWGIEAAEALEYAHSVGVVHRDIKLANLMIDGQGKLWVTDFGLAQTAADSGLTMTGDLLGTLRYMSPEQALAKHGLVDHHTDVYSLGVTLYELLTLHPAVEGNDRQEILRRIAFEEPVPLRRMNKAIPAELETIVLKAMAKEPDQRYGTARELADDLRCWLEDRPIRARRPSLVQRVSKWTRRHPSLVASTLATLILAVVALTVGNLLIAHEKNEKETALQVAQEAKTSAETREAETRAVLEFVESRVFGAARPDGQEGGLGYQVRLREAVEMALPYLEDGFPDQPLIEARLRMAIGKSFSCLGDYQIAAEQYKRAYALYAEHLGPDQADTLKSMCTLGTAYLDLGRDADGLKLCEETLAIQKAKLGPDHPDTLRSMRIVASAYRKFGRQTDALNLLEETLALAKAKLGPDDPETLQVMFHLAVYYDRLGHPAEALKRYQETLELQKARLGPSHPQTLMTMTNMAGKYFDLGRPDECNKLREETLKLQKAKLGPEHPGTLIGMMNLAQGYARLGRHAEAIKLNEAALPLLKTKIPDDVNTAICMNNLSQSYSAIGRYDKAIPLYRELIQLKKDFPAVHSSLGEALAAKGQLDEAIAEYREDIRLHKDSAKGYDKSSIGSQVGLPPDLLQQTWLAQTHYKLGNALSRKGQVDEAIAEYHEAIRLKEDYAEAHCNLGHAFLQKGQFRQSVESLRRGHELGSRNPRWPYPSAQWLLQAKQMAQLDDRLSTVLQGKDQPKNADERLAFAQICQLQRRKDYAAAARFYAEALAAEPKRAEDLKTQLRYNAACAAALAGCGQGKDADKLDTKERARLRQQALDWLQADLKAYRQLMDKSASKSGPAIAQRMQHWLDDADFAGLRGEEALAKLPEAERQAWHKLWQEVETLRQQAAATTKSVDQPKDKEGSPRKD